MRAPIRWNVVIAAHRAVALACVVLAGALAAAGCSGSLRCPSGASCPAPSAPILMYQMAINGQAASYAGEGTQPHYHIRPGERLQMTVVVTLPGHLKITTLWLGISTGTWGNGPGGRPIGMKPILARSSRLLTAGAHTFRLRWRVPSSQSGGPLYLVWAWSSHRPPVHIAGAVAVLALH
jgi:hypothetical protein